MVPGPGQHRAQQVKGTLPASPAPGPLDSEPSDVSPLPTVPLPLALGDSVTQSFSLENKQCPALLHRGLQVLPETTAFHLEPPPPSREWCGHQEPQCQGSWAFLSLALPCLLNIHLGGVWEGNATDLVNSFTSSSHGESWWGVGGAQGEAGPGRQTGGRGCPRPEDPLPRLSWRGGSPQPIPQAWPGGWDLGSEVRGDRGKGTNSVLITPSLPPPRGPQGGGQVGALGGKPPDGHKAESGPPVSPGAPRQWPELPFQEKVREGQVAAQLPGGVPFPAP